MDALDAGVSFGGVDRAAGHLDYEVCGALRQALDVVGVQDEFVNLPEAADAAGGVHASECVPVILYLDGLFPGEAAADVAGDRVCCLSPGLAQHEPDVGVCAHAGCELRANGFEVGVEVLRSEEDGSACAAGAGVQVGDPGCAEGAEFVEDDGAHVGFAPSVACEASERRTQVLHCERADGSRGLGCACGVEGEAHDVPGTYRLF